MPGGRESVSRLRQDVESLPGRVIADEKPLGVDMIDVVLVFDRLHDVARGKIAGRGRAAFKPGFGRPPDLFGATRAGKSGNLGTQ